MRSSLNGVQAHGYTLPRIVFWNLRGSDRGDGRNASLPVTKGVSMNIQRTSSLPHVHYCYVLCGII